MEAIDLIEEAVVYAFEHNDLEHLFKPAPREIFERFLKARPIGDPIVKTATINIPYDDRKDRAPLSFRMIKQERQVAAS